MKRRRALGLIGLAAAGAVVFPACEFTKVPLLNNFTLEKSQFKALRELSARILPIPEEMILEKMSPTEFMLVMIDDCETQEEILKFKTGMDAFFLANKKIAKLSEEELASMMGSDFLQKVKSYSVTYYTGLEKYLDTYTDYEFIPGRFIGCVKV